MSTRAEKVARQYVDGLNALDIDAVIALFASDAVVRYPGLGATDVPGFRSYLEQVAAALTSIHLEEKEMFATENGAAARWSLDVTVPSGRTAHCEGIDSWVVGEDDKIHVLDAVYDPTPLLQAVSA